MKVLVTGHRGYIGSVLVRVLSNAGHEVTGLDTDWFHGCDFGRIEESVPSIDMDVRDIEAIDLAPFDAVIHLAAVSDDTSGDIDEALTEEINLQATLRLAWCCKSAGISRLIFASSCSVYGTGMNRLLDETSPVSPQSAYASSKLACERHLLDMTDSSFKPVLLRLATTYGVSPRLRMDIVVNDFVGSAVATGRVCMKTDGRAWRPLIHVEDVARVFAAVVAAPDEAVAGEVFNVARPAANHRIIDIADEVADSVPQCIRQAPRQIPDRSSYRVRGDKLHRTFPALKMRWTLPLGIRQLTNAMGAAGMSSGLWRSERYRRHLRLHKLVELGEIDNSFRRAPHPVG